MKEKELNIVPIIQKILEKDALHEFYCTAVGPVNVMLTTYEPKCPIIFTDTYSIILTPQGKLYEAPGECILFPSKENRDWSTMIVPQNELKPFDRVLVRDSDNDKWTANFYSHNRTDREYPFGVMFNIYKQCIPYKGNEELLGTTNNPRK